MKARSSDRRRGKSDHHRLARRPVLERLEERMVMATFTVTSAADSGAGTLRDAINGVNASGDATNIIDFAIGSGARTINLLSPLASIANQVTIQGQTQPGFAGTPLIFVNGINAGAGQDGFQFLAGASDSTISFLAIGGFGAAGIEVNAKDVVIVGCYVGTDTSGTTAVPNRDGIDVVSGSAIIGSGDPAGRNVVAGNTAYGVILDSNGSQVLGNSIGVGANGQALGNGASGLIIFDDSNTISGNVISGNGLFGVELEGSSNRITSNFIGTNAAGTAAIPNQFSGIQAVLFAASNTIGGVGLGNVIAGNGDQGIKVLAADVGNVIQGNRIGIGTNDVALPNLANGILIQGTTGTTIGGYMVGEGNVISGNGVAGISLSGNGTNNNLVVGNLVGTNATGTSAVANAGGIGVDAGTGNTIGGTLLGARNLISGNTSFGVSIKGVASTGTILQGNRIGTNAAGNGALANGVGVVVNAPGETIGGPAVASAGNVISGNTAAGVSLMGTAAGATITGNIIGTDSNGDTALGNATGIVVDNVGGVRIVENQVSGNGGTGILIQGAASSTTSVLANRVGTNSAGNSGIGSQSVGIDVRAAGTTIGGTAANSGNLVSANSGDGIRVAADNVVLARNIVGLNQAGTAPLPNLGNGVFVFNNSGVTVGGSAAAGNTISGNAGNGVAITGGSLNVVAANLIGTDGAGAAALGNGVVGVVINGSSRNTVGVGNVISGNALAGVSITGTASAQNLVAGNVVGLNAAGTAALANGVGVVISGGATTNVVGGVTPALANTIAGNTSIGVRISGAGTSINAVVGNLIGNRAGAAFSNSIGVQIDAGATGNLIGTTISGSANVISGNAGSGVLLTGSGTSGNAVVNNLIGTTAAGTGSLPNGDGVAVASNAAANTIGGLNAASRNIVSGNSLAGVALSTAGLGNVIVGNSIGVDINGAADPNAVNGVTLVGTSGATIGGTLAGAGNLISGNTGFGISVSTGGSNVIAGNFVGTNAAGTASIANTSQGILIANSGGNTIGGSVVAARNIVSGNALWGVSITGAASAGNLVAGNYIGTDVGGTTAIANGRGGVILAGGANGNAVGGSTPALRNVISGNSTQNEGVRITGAGTSGNVVAGNYIGLNAAGLAALPNATDGVNITGGATNNTVGGAAGSGNVISGNTQNGVRINGVGTSINAVVGNTIGLNAAGAVLANGNDGVLIVGGATSNTIGTGNVISGNATHGVEITGAGTSNNVVAGNTIGGTAANGTSGVRITSSASGNTVGAGNLISANPVGVRIDALATGNFVNGGNTITASTLNGVELASDANTVAANAITNNGGDGVAVTGSANTIGAGNTITGNLSDGLDITGSNNVVTGNTITGNAVDGALISGAGNSISGNLLSLNSANGLEINGPGATNNVASGNLIGTTADGLGGLANGQNGVLITNGATGNSIGAGNVISANGLVGVQIDSPSNFVTGNIIGLDANGAADLGNAFDGILLAVGADGNTILDNTVSGNDINGVRVLSSINLIQGNRIGTNAAGTADLGNGGVGVLVTGGSGNTIALGNVISGNGLSGISLSGQGATNNVVALNSIGTDITGNVGLGNDAAGVLINAGAANTIAGNVISANGASGVSISGLGASLNAVIGNRIGTNFAGTADLGNALHGVALGAFADQNTIGGFTGTFRNVISGNGGNGVALLSTGPANRIIGNYIGTDVSGSSAIPNDLAGVLVSTTPNATIGGSESGASNVISGNLRDGIEVAATSTGVVISQNLIGTDATGTAALPNGQNGVLVTGSTDVTIGGLLAGTGNLISGNALDGVRIDAGSARAQVSANFIGSDINGTAAVPNGQDGVRVVASTAATIGGTVLGARNIIGGNAGNGVELDSGADGALVAGNFIGVGRLGNPLPNGQDGILIDGATNVTVGGSLDGANVVSNNGVDGIKILAPGGSTVTFNTFSGNVEDGVHASSNSNLIASNTITSNGVNGVIIDNGGTGNSVRANTITGNAADGVQITAGASLNTVGGATAADRNLISANDRDGVRIADASGNFVTGNYIGTDASGTADLGNGQNGVVIFNTNNNSATGNVVRGNLISGNQADGVGISGPNAAGNLIVGNVIGVDATGAVALGNGQEGVEISNQANLNTVGGTTVAARNVIGGNALNGVAILGLASNNLVAGNFIGLDSTGTSAIPNLGNGVLIDNASGNTVGAGNLISGNAQNGVAILNASATGNVVAGNAIGLNSSGQVVGNGEEGVILSLGANLNTVGPNNTISGNTLNGVRITGNGTSQNLITGNTLGGTALTGNGQNGVLIDAGASANTVNGANVITFNARNGVVISGASANLVAANTINQNVLDGVLINAAATLNTISANIIDANGSNGVEITGLGTAGNVVIGNTIGEAGLGNTLDGVLISDAATDNEVVSNAIGSNGGNGVRITGAGTSINAVVANTINANVLSGARVDSQATVNLIQSNVIRQNNLDGVRVDSGAFQNNIDVNAIEANGGNGILITDAGTTGNLATGNSIGVGGANGLDGVRITNNASANTLGGTTVAARNIISGNTGNGVQIAGGADSNLILGNYIGTNVVGGLALPNLQNGVLVTGSGTTGNSISGNVISGNSLSGVVIEQLASGTSVAGNRIGTDFSGTGPVANGGSGVVVQTGASNNTVNGGNVISGNAAQGVLILGSASGAGTTGNLIAGNFIGTDINGTKAVPNGANGVLVQGTRSVETNVIGAGNLISGNALNGVALDSASGTTVASNTIGLGATGLVLPNGVAGVLIANGSTGNTVNAGNVIAGNTTADVAIVDSTSNLVSGNRIGNTSVGVVPVGVTAAVGVSITGASTQNTVSANTIRGAYATSGVLIRGNGATSNMVLGNAVDGNLGSGVQIDTGAANIIVRANTIGLGAAGSSPNGLHGVLIASGATGNVVGGFDAADSNVIAGNASSGVAIDRANGNFVYRNYIGQDAGGTIRPNLFGIFVTAANDNIIGGTGGGRNFIAGNTLNNIQVQDGSTRNRIAYNFIGTTLDGQGVPAGVATRDNVSILNSPANSIVGNNIAGAKSDGVEITGEGSTGNFLTGNIINQNAQNGVNLNGGSSATRLTFNILGLNQAGDAARPNGAHGIAVSNSTGNLIGGLGQGNTISGNAATGLALDTGANANTVSGNAIGLGLNGAAFPNGFAGVFVNNASANLIGTSNVISANGSFNVLIQGAQSTGNSVTGNSIGLNRPGDAGVGAVTTQAGVRIASGASGTLVSNNTIGNHRRQGVEILNASNNLLTGNKIGTNAAGTAVFRNGERGVDISGGTGNTVGAGNLISGNLQHNVLIAGGSGNLVTGSVIGLNAAGTAPLRSADGAAVGLLVLNSNANTVSGNVISGNGSDGVQLVGSGSMNNVVVGNKIGTNAAGTVAIANLGHGVLLATNDSANTVGGTTPAARNLISGNGKDGLYLSSTRTSVVAGNYIGTDVTGTQALGNAANGVELAFSSNNTIGGTVQGAGNLIAGNGQNNVVLRNNSSDNVIVGNTIGTTAAGAAAIRTSTAAGILLDGSSRNAIAGNLVSGQGNGIVLRNNANANVLTNNNAGTNAGGTARIPNATHGVLIQGSRDNTVGAGNVLSGNGSTGIALDNASFNVVTGNNIGTTLDGKSPLGNGAFGVYLVNSRSNTIGTGNVISGNGVSGVRVQGGADNVITGNIVGLDNAGVNALGNAEYGIVVADSPANRIDGNVTSANAIGGILVAGGASAGNVLTANLVGTRADGTVPARVNGRYPLSNGNPDLAINLDGFRTRITGQTVDRGNGIVIRNAPGTSIGGIASGQGNLIAGNDLSGIVIDNGQEVITTPVNLGTVVRGNVIGIAAGGAAAGNFLGIYVRGTTGNVIGGAIDPASSALGAGNVVSNSVQDGIRISFNGAGVGNVVAGNRIGTSVDGTLAAGNKQGILIVGGANNVIGGSDPGLRNVISGNTEVGVNVLAAVPPIANAVGGDFDGPTTTPGASATGNVISNNVIGLDINRRMTTAIAPIGSFRKEAANQNVNTSTIDPDLLDKDLGVFIDSAANTRVTQNTISGGLGGGVAILGYAAVGTTLTGNAIGTIPGVNPSKVFTNTVGVFLDALTSNATQALQGVNRTNQILSVGQTVKIRFGVAGPVVSNVVANVNPFIPLSALPANPNPSVTGPFRSLSVFFSDYIVPARAQDLRNYELVNLTTGSAIPLRSATYDSIQIRVVLDFADGVVLNSTDRFRLTVRSGATAIVSANSGAQLDGNFDGLPGSRFDGTYTFNATAGRYINDSVRLPSDPTIRIKAVKTLKSGLSFLGGN